MYDIKSDTDYPLTFFLNDYVEGLLENTERSAFEEYLTTDNEISSLTHKSKSGKQALNNAYQVKAADDFEEKLARCIAEEKDQMQLN